MKDIQAEVFKKWVDDGHDHDLILTKFPHREHFSTVVDCGGYIGKWARDIAEFYKEDTPQIHMIEPVLKHCAAAQLLNEGYPNIHIHCIAASSFSGASKISQAQEGSSMHQASALDPTIYTIDIVDFLNANGLSTVDLMKINIEGEEFNLIDHLVKSGKIKDIDTLMIQTHPFVLDAEQKYIKMHQQLEATHQIVWKYPWIWDCWKRKS